MKPTLNITLLHDLTGWASSVTINIPKKSPKRSALHYRTQSRVQRVKRPSLFRQSLCSLLPLSAKLLFCKTAITSNTPIKCVIDIILKLYSFCKSGNFALYVSTVTSTPSYKSSPSWVTRPRWPSKHRQCVGHHFGMLELDQTTVFMPRAVTAVLSRCRRRRCRPRVALHLVSVDRHFALQTLLHANVLRCRLQTFT